jgi:hypothetical protein
MAVKEINRKSKATKEQVNRQLKDIKLVIQDLLRKRVEELKALPQKQEQYQQSSSNESNSSYSKVTDFLDRIKLEIVDGPTSDTIRKFREFLNNVAVSFKDLPSGSVRNLLNLIFDFIPYTKISKYVSGNYESKKENYAGNKKGSDIRILLRDTLLKFVHDNGIKYLNDNGYPETYKEALKYDEFKQNAELLAEQETARAKSKLVKPTKAEQQAEYDLKYDAEQLAREIAETGKAGILRRFLEYIGDDPANRASNKKRIILENLFIDNIPVLETLERIRYPAGQAKANKRDLKKVGDTELSTAVSQWTINQLAGIDPADARAYVQGHLNADDRRALNDIDNQPDRFKYLASKGINYENVENFLKVLKASLATNWHLVAPALIAP